MFSARERVLVGASALGAGAVLACRTLGDFDLPWHLAFGRLVAASGGAPAVDDLTFVHPKIPYSEWLGDLFFYGVARAFGTLGLQLVGGAAVLAIVLVLALRAADDAARAARGLMVLLALPAMAPWLLVRPATLTFVFVGVFAWLLEQRKDWALALLLPLTALWANVHQGVVLAPPLALGYALHAQLQKMRGITEPGPSALRVAGAALGVIVGASLTRAGPALLLRPFLTAPLAALATEWRPMTLGFLLDDEPFAGLFLLVVAVALAFGRDARTDSRAVTPFDVVLVLLSIALLRYVRMIPLAVVLLAPLAARRLGGLVASFGEHLARGLRVASMVALVLAPLALLVRIRADLGKGFEPAHFPEAAVRFVEENAFAGNMYNFSPYGGYLEWRLYPRHRAFIDGRMLDIALTARAQEAEREPAVFEALAAEHDMQWAVCRATENEHFCLPIFASPAWQMVFWDDVSAVYVKPGGPNAALAASGYARLRHLMPPDQFLALAMRATTKEEAAILRRDGDRALAQAPASPRGALLAACGALAQDDTPAFERARASIVLVAPGHTALDVIDRAWTIHHARAVSAPSAP